MLCASLYSCAVVAKLVVRTFCCSVTLRVRRAVPSASSRLKVCVRIWIARYRTDHDRVDIIEEIISEEIVDETDRYEDNQSKKRARRLKNASVMRG